MQHARQLLLLVAFSCSRAPWVHAQSPSPAPLASTATSASDLSRERTLLNESDAARSASDYATARTKAAEAVASLLARPSAEQSAAWLGLLESAGFSARSAQDLRTAKAAWQRVLEGRLLALSDDHADVQQVRGNLSNMLRGLGDLQGARALQEKVLEVGVRTLPDDHPKLQWARTILGVTLLDLGDLHGARNLFEKVLEVDSRILPDEHSDLQAARLNFATTLSQLGDLAGARALLEKVLEVWSRTLPDDHPSLQVARANVAAVIKALGDLQGARALEEKVLEVCMRTLPGEHPELQSARGNLAATLADLGDLQGARVLEEQVLEVLSRTLSDDHPDLLRARHNVGVRKFQLGDLGSARALQEQVLEMRSRRLPDDHPELQGSRLSLAATLRALGDLQGARALQELVLEVYARTLPDDHPDVQRARESLALTLKALGDLQGARAMQEQVLEISSRALPDDHPDLQRARSNLASMLQSLGDPQGARALFEKVVDVFSHTLPEDHPDLLAVRENQAVNLHELRDYQSARPLLEQLLEVISRTSSEEEPLVQATRLNLAATLYALGDFESALPLFEHVLEAYARTLPAEHPYAQQARQDLVLTIARLYSREGASSPATERDRRKAQCATVARAFTVALEGMAREIILKAATREAEERCANLHADLGLALSFASGLNVFATDPEFNRLVFAASERTRGGAVLAAAWARAAHADARYEPLRVKMQAASADLARMAQNGARADEFAAARTRREEAERKLYDLAKELVRGAEGALDADATKLAATLNAREALVSYRKYKRLAMEVVASDTGSSTESLCAFVLRSDNRLTRIELGPIASIEAAVARWRRSIGVQDGSEGLIVTSSSIAGTESTRGVGVQPAPSASDSDAGEELRIMLFDPLHAALDGAERVIVCPDDVLHLIPLDALPAMMSSRDNRDGDVARIGDTVRIETRATLTELLIDARAPTGSALVALGGASFSAPPVALTEPVELTTPLTSTATVMTKSDGVALLEDVQPIQVAALLRGTAWEQGFTPLTHTAEESRGIGMLYTKAYGVERPVLVLEKSRASREALEELAPKARFVHIATHGWFAPESIKSWNDSEPLDKQTGLALRTRGEEQVKGMSPMLLCGLAFAGANLPETAAGRVPGLMTADELSTLDLSSCELVVLSACDTNVGERRAGQGVASLQKALQMAGARSVITSLWKVPDEATKELMLDFYRRLWSEKKPKSQALWEAKQKLRETKDESGALKYTTRDWAAWVLTGEPL